VEAIAATLYIVGLKEEAATILAPFKWGLGFLDVNREVLEGYSGASDSASVLRFQASWLAEAEREAAARHGRSRDLPPSDSESDGEREGGDDDDDEGDDGTGGGAAADSTEAATSATASKTAAAGAAAAPAIA